MELITFHNDSRHSKGFSMNERRLYIIIGLSMLLISSIAQSGVVTKDSSIEDVMVILDVRHGIRKPTASLESYTTNPGGFPAWYNTNLGCLTPNGLKVERSLGAYFKNIFITKKLINIAPGANCPNDESYYFRSDSFQRTWWSAKGIAEGLFPNCNNINIYAINSSEYNSEMPQNDPGLVCTDANDPLFFPLEDVTNPPKMDPLTGKLSVAGSIGATSTETDNLTAAYQSQLDVIQGATTCCQPSACSAIGNCTLDKIPASIDASESSVALNGPVTTGGVITADWLMGYQDGLTEGDVAFGLTINELKPLFDLNNMVFDSMYSAPYIAQAEGSNLMRQILLCLQQGASNRYTRGAVCSPRNKLVMFMGHDDNLHLTAGILRTSWINSGYMPQQTPAGSGFVFTLGKKGHKYYVKTQFFAQTPDQQREISNGLINDAIPSIVDLNVPGCISPKDLPYYCPLENFSRIVYSAINAKFITPVQRYPQ